MIWLVIPSVAFMISLSLWALGLRLRNKELRIAVAIWKTKYWQLEDLKYPEASKLQAEIAEYAKRIMGYPDNIGKLVVGPLAVPGDHNFLNSFLVLNFSTSPAITLYGSNNIISNLESRNFLEDRKPLVEEKPPV